MATTPTFIVIATIAWLFFVALGARFVVTRARRRVSLAQFRRSWQLLYLLPILLAVAWILYSMGLSLLNGRIKLPVRGPDSYFSLAQSPELFWFIFLFEFLLTGAVSVVASVAMYLGLPGQRR